MSLPALLPHPILVTDSRRLSEPLPHLARLPRGAAIILRHYDWTAPRRIALLDHLRPLARRRGVRLILADPIPGSGGRLADGVHLPEFIGRHGCLARVLLWRRAKPNRLITMACHGALALARARALDLDMALLSPILPTASHPGAPTLGPIRAALLAAGPGRAVPLAALGGVGKATARRLPSGVFVAIAGIFTGPFPARPR